MREIRTLRATWRGLETWNGRITTAAGAPVLDPTCERLEVKFLRPTHPYIPMQRGFLYLAAVMDWSTRKVLSWRVSNTMDVEFCIEALEEALARFGRPDIFNSDQGSQFTSPRFTGILQAAGVRISMDGRGRWMDNVFIERLWRSLKYECIYLHAFETGTDLRAGLTSWIAYLQYPPPAFDAGRAHA
jgi:putative transposase